MGRFQSRNRDAFRFKGIPQTPSALCYQSFQSRNRDAFRFKFDVVFNIRQNCRLFQFQSRNRDAFRFKDAFSSGGKRVKWVMFQSRNRDAFRFKILADMLRSWLLDCFNLGIEMLFISSHAPMIASTISPIMFQSRNRDAFRFKFDVVFNIRPRLFQFQSRNRDAFRFKVMRSAVGASASNSCFNLGIEMLFVSRYLRICSEVGTGLFQSRNRDAFHFKSSPMIAST